MAEIRAVPATTFTIYRAGGYSTISGIALSADVKDGALIISVSGTPSYIFSPGQWLTVNFNPNV
jgi:hypothetical protein